MVLLFTFVLSLFHLDIIDTTFCILFLPYFSNRVILLSFLFSLFFLYFFFSLSLFASSLSLSLLFLHRLFLPHFFKIIILFFLRCFSLLFQTPVVPILPIIQTSHLPGQLSVANLFNNLMAAIYLFPRLSQQQPVLTNLTFPSLLSFLYPVSVFCCSFLYYLYFTRTL